ncbi:MAG TPA: molybdenum cofactor guanylyltransferase [Candidatus Acidoferrum sp.]|nr:molybdenum cofactor guanylyltransferase [Candidatus Acidoferrum sp.]
MASDECRVASKESKTHGLAGYVMAGGGSTRFGVDKARAELNGETMLTRMSRLVRELTGTVSIVAPSGRYADSGERVVEDHWPGEGPLGGIITALMDAQRRNHRETWCLIVGCDMPFLTGEWLVYLKERALASRAAIVTPQSLSGLEPLCSCWHTSAAGKLQYAFEDGTRKVTEAMKRVSMEVVGEKDWARFEKSGRLFWNMNTPAEYEEARRILEAGER